MQKLPQGENQPGTNKKPLKTQHIEIVLQIKWAFWVPIYLKTLCLFCWTFGTSPDLHSVKQTLRKGMKVIPAQPQKQKGVMTVLKRLVFPFSRTGGRVKSL